MNNSGSKIKSFEELIPIIKKHRANNKKIVLCHGSFDLIHYGHLHYFQESKKLGDVLIVSVVADEFVRRGLDKPVFDEKKRTNLLSVIEPIDYVFICEDFGPWEIIKKIKPDIYTKGEDVAPQLENPNSGVSRDKKAIESVGGTFVLTKTITNHSTNILDAYSKSLSSETLSYLTNIREKYNVADIILDIEKLKKLKVLVIGETIVDEYRYVAPLGKPAKAHIVAAHYINKDEFAGGVLNCANHVASICENVEMVTCLGGKNSKKDFIEKNLKQNIKAKFFFNPKQTTIIKRRFVDPSNYLKLFEEYEFDKNFLPKEIENEVKKYLEKVNKKYDLTIVFDYGHGFFSKEIIKTIVDTSNFLVINTQTNSGNAGFNYITKYPQGDYICIDEMEARLANQDDFSDIESILLNLYKRMKAKKMVITLGRHGSIGYDKKSGFKRTPSFASKITDSVGAGDAFLAISAPCAAAGFPMELVSFLGNVASSIVVSVIGNKTSIERKELFRRIGYLLAD